MTPPALPNLSGLAWSRHKKPSFSTRVVSHVSGREVRLPLMSYPLYEFEAVYNGLSSSATAAFANLGTSSLQSLMGFFLQLLGQAGVFLYTDPDDNTVLGQTIGVGDGTTQQFVISRTLGGFSEPVSYVTALNAVYLNGTAQPANDWLFTAPNMLAFASPPGAGAAITADFTFAFQCRFFADQLDFEEFMSALWKLDSVKFRSIKANTSATAAVIPSWYTSYQVGGTMPYAFADFTTQGTTNHYLFNGNVYSSASAWLTAAGGTYTNSTGKMVLNASGLLASVAANTLPFNHDMSGNVLGLLLEGASTNLFTYSQVLSNVAWTTGAATATANVATAPDGTSTANTIADNSTNSWHGIFQEPAIGGTRTISCFAKANTLSAITLLIQDASGGGWAAAVYDLSGGTVSQTGYNSPAALVQASIQNFGNGWYRCSLTSTSAATMAYCLLGTVPAATGNTIGGGGLIAYSGSGKSAYFWGAQLENLPAPSSYIPTTGSIASRAADSLYLPWTATTFTARVKAALTGQVNGAYLADTGHGVLTEAAGPDAQTSNGATALTTGITAFTSSNIIVVGGSSGGRVLSANGNAAASDSNALVPSAGTEFYIGQSSGGASQANGNYAQVGLWNVAATAAQAATNSGSA